MRLSKSKTGVWLCSFCLCWIGLHAVFPPVRGYLGKVAVALQFLCCAILYFYLFLNYRYIHIPSWYTLLQLLFLLYSVIIPLLFNCSVWANRYFSLSIFLLSYPLQLYFNRKGFESEERRIALFLLLISTISICITAYNLISNPWLVRSIKSEGDLSISILRMGVGGYEIIYYAMFLAIASFYCFVHHENNRVIFLLFCILCSSVVFLSNYFTALLLLLLGFCISLSTGWKGWKRLLPFFICIIGLCLLPLLMDAFISMLEYISPDGRVYSTISEFEGGFSTGVLNEFLSDRGPTIIRNFEFIYRNFFFGAIPIPVDSVLQDLGQHSTILDTLGIWGVPFGSVYLILLFYSIMKMNINPAIAIPFTTLAFINNLTPSIAIAVFFIVPCLCVKNETSSHRKPPVE